MESKYIAAIIICVIVVGGGIGVFLWMGTLEPAPEPTYKAAFVMGGDETDMGFSYMTLQGA